MISDLWGYVREDDLLVVVPPTAAAAVFKHLGKFALFDKVSMDDVSGDLALLSIWGPQAGAALAAALGQEPPGEPLSNTTSRVSGHELVVARNDLVDLPGWDLIVQRAGFDAIGEALVSAGATLVSADAVEQVRVEAGLPWFGVDMDEKTIPVEAGLKERAISYDKGCYLGQEVIVRIEHRGKVNRVLVGFRIEGDEPVVVPARVFRDDKEVGEITSCVRSPRLGTIGLGILHKKHHDATLIVEPPDGRAATVCALPFA